MPSPHAPGGDPVPREDSVLREDSGAARRARSFGGVAAAYHAARTTYSAASVAWALEPAGPGRLRVLDLAAGTGLLTAALLAHRPVPDVIAVEPDAGMRAEYLRHQPGLLLRAGTAEAIGGPDGGPDSGFDAVVVGTAFHWFDQVTALPEMARVLRDAGVLAALWTGPDEEVDWVRGYREAARAALSTTEQSTTEQAAAEQAAASGAGGGQPSGIGSHPLFTDFETATFRHTEVRAVSAAVRAVNTYSDVITAAPADRAAAVRATAAQLRARLDAVGPADPDRPDSIEIPVVVTVIRGQRRPRGGAPTT